MKTLFSFFWLSLCFYLPLYSQNYVNTTGGVDTAWVRHYGAGLRPTDNRAYDVAIDADGNVYVTGNTATIKYSSTGAPLWIKPYTGTALVLDKSGCVFITGNSGTMKLSDDGAQLWHRSCAGVAIVLDKIGNVILAGTRNYDGIVTAKYSSLGDSLWARYDDISSGYDQASALVVDDSGNIYVTGKSFNDFVTIKYNSFGDLIWTSLYNGPAISYHCTGCDVDIDKIGNVYVTGYCYWLNQNGYVTIKYNPLGDTVWVRLFDGPGGIGVASSLVVDDSGNVYVTAYSVGFIGTIKYSSEGTQLWRGIYGGTDISLDLSGNVYVTGFGGEEGGSNRTYFTTTKYNLQGDTIWVKRYFGSGVGSSALVVDSNGNAYVAGYQNFTYHGIDDWTALSEADYLTIKYGMHGDSVWCRVYNSPSTSDDVATAFAVDSNGDIYVTGRSTGSDFLSNFTTIKYNAKGETSWVRRYHDQGGYSDIPWSLAVDNEGNVFVGGNVNVNRSEWKNFLFGDYATIKYTPLGDTVWVRRHDGVGAFNNYSLALDKNNNVYVIIPIYGTIKFSNDGYKLWRGVYGGNALTVDGSGNVYVTGYSNGLGTFRDYATIKYNSNGDTLWERRYNGPGNGDDIARSLAVDGSGNVYVTGSSEGLGIEADYATIKYDSNGNEVWVRRYNGPDNRSDYPKSLVVDGSGNVYVTGESYGGFLTSYDYATIKYNSNGDAVWVRRYNGLRDWFDVAFSLAVDGSGNVYVTGESDGEIVTIKYNSTGTEEWIAKYSYGSGTSSTPVGIKLDASGNVYVAGTSSGNGQSVYTIIKYMQTPTSVEHSASDVPTKFGLNKNYPNPFNPTTTISFSIPNSAITKLLIYDVLGREVAVLVNEQKEAGKYSVQWDARGSSSGLYFYRLKSESYTATKKMILLR